MASSRCYTRRIGWDSLNHPGSEKCTSTSPAPPPHFALLGSHSGPAPLNQPPLPPNADRGGTTPALPQQRGTFSLLPGYACVPRAEWLRRYHDMVLAKGAHVWYKGDDGLWWLEKSAQVQPRTTYIWSDFWTTRGRSNFLFPPARYTTSTGAVRGSWCLQVHIASAFPRGMQRNVDESRGAAVASWFSSRHRSSLVFLLFFFGS